MTAQSPDLILASASPRRRDLLERMGLILHVAAVDLDETPRPDEQARTYVSRLASAKREAAAARLPGEIAHLPLLAADTTVVLDQAILGKPADAAEAESMLRSLAGRRHEVITAYSISFGARLVNRAVTTSVSFRLLDDGEIAAYVACREWEGKAGGYAIQGIASAFASELRGSLTNVIGLPLAEVIADLRALDALPRYPGAGFGAPP